MHRKQKPQPGTTVAWTEIRRSKAKIFWPSSTRSVFAEFGTSSLLLRLTKQPCAFITRVQHAASGMLFANDHDAAATFIFDLHDPLHQPRSLIH